MNYNQLHDKVLYFFCLLLILSSGVSDFSTRISQNIQNSPKYLAYILVLFMWFGMKAQKKFQWNVFHKTNFSKISWLT